QVIVSDLPVVAAAANNFSANPGQSITKTLTTFTDPGGSEAADGSHYNATINWGDGSNTSSGTISGPDANGVFTVIGTHTYTTTAPFTYTLTIGTLGNAHGNSPPVTLTGMVTAGADPATTTTVTSSLNPSVLGQSVTFTATVSPA